MLNSILNYSRFVLLGIAMAFVINPYAYADEMYEENADEDGDTIVNSSDVCIEDSYDKDEHKKCLSRAGVTVIVFGGLSSDEFKNRLDEEYRELTGKKRLSAAEGISWVIDHIFLKAGVPENNWNDLNIGTCLDLDTYAKSLKAYGEELGGWVKPLGIKFPLIGKRDPTYSARKALSLLLKKYSDMYLSAYQDTKTAYNQLCGEDRLKKKQREENPE
ncbi:MAG: hypothetical protein OXH84_07085 [Gammaproteobacteria bacterium]|nr:hypothetical protein [Gammaproteobacteria bacterium]